MATIVPISHSIRWRSRSRNSSMDLLDQHANQHSVSSSQSPGLLQSTTGTTLDANEWDEEASDDEEALFDELQTSAWLIVPREFANVTQRRGGRDTVAAPVSLHAGPGYAGAGVKSMERRRADSSEL